MEWNGMEWNGMEWNGMEWNGYCSGVRSCTLFSYSHPNARSNISLAEEGRAKPYLLDPAKQPLTRLVSLLVSLLLQAVSAALDILHLLSQTLQACKGCLSKGEKGMGDVLQANMLRNCYGCYSCMLGVFRAFLKEKKEKSQSQSSQAIKRNLEIVY
jgi:hypothetical protein